jgi:hypothetical protein
MINLVGTGLAYKTFRKFWRLFREFGKNCRERGEKKIKDRIKFFSVFADK